MNCVRENDMGINKEINNERVSGLSMSLNDVGKVVPAYLNEGNSNGMLIKNSNKADRDFSSLLDYYRKKLEGFEKERISWLEKLELMRHNFDDHHKIQWELETRNTEILNLQINKTEITRAINLERQRVAQLVSELEFYKERSNQDRRRIVQLLRLTEPVEQQIKLMHHRRPQRTEKHNDYSMGKEEQKNEHNERRQSAELKRMNNTIMLTTNSTNNTNSVLITRLNTNNLNTSTDGGGRISTGETISSISKLNTKINNNTNVTKSFKSVKKILSKLSPQTTDYNQNSNTTIKIYKRSHSFSRRSLSTPHTPQYKLENRIRPTLEKQTFIRTIILPDTQKSELHLEVEFLKRQITEIRSFYEDMIHKQALQSKDLEIELRLHLENEKIKYSELLKAKQKSEGVSLLMTKELVNLKYEYSKNEKKIYEEIDLVKIQNQALITAMKELSILKDLERDNYLSEQHRLTEQTVNYHKQLVFNYQMNFKTIKEQYGQLQKIFNARVGELIDRYGKLREKYRQLEVKSGNFSSSSLIGKNFDNINLLVSEINELNKRIKLIEGVDLSKTNARVSFISDTKDSNANTILKIKRNGKISKLHRENTISRSPDKIDKIFKITESKDNFNDEESEVKVNSKNEGDEKGVEDIDSRERIIDTNTEQNIILLKTSNEVNEIDKDNSNNKDNTVSERRIGNYDYSVKSINIEDIDNSNKINKKNSNKLSERQNFEMAGNSNRMKNLKKNEIKKKMAERVERVEKVNAEKIDRNKTKSNTKTEDNSKSKQKQKKTLEKNYLNYLNNKSSTKNSPSKLKRSFNVKLDNENNSSPTKSFKNKYNNLYNIDGIKSKLGELESLVQNMK